MELLQITNNANIFFDADEVANQNNEGNWWWRMGWWQEWVDDNHDEDDEDDENDEDDEDAEDENEDENEDDDYDEPGCCRVAKSMGPASETLQCSHFLSRQVL